MSLSEYETELKDCIYAFDFCYLGSPDMPCLACGYYHDNWLQSEVFEFHKTIKDFAAGKRFGSRLEYITDFNLKIGRRMRENNTRSTTHVHNLRRVGLI